MVYYFSHAAYLQPSRKNRKGGWKKSQNKNIKQHEKALSLTSINITASPHYLLISKDHGEQTSI